MVIIYDDLQGLPTLTCIGRQRMQNLTLHGLPNLNVHRVAKIPRLVLQPASDNKICESNTNEHTLNKDQ